MSDVLISCSGLMAPQDTGRPEVRAFFDKRTFSLQYVVWDSRTGACAIIDPVLDFDEKSGSTATRSADAILAFIEEKGLKLEWILDTHPHADHFSAAGYLKDRTGAPTATGENVVKVQRLWKGLYNLPDSFRTDGSQWDRLFADGDRFQIGGLDASVMFCPGHTMTSITFVVGDAAFIHDTLFMPDGGSARTDFPGGDARALWNSIQRIWPFRPRPACSLATTTSRGPEGGVGEHRCPSEVRERACPGSGRSQLREAPNGAGSDLADAQADPAVPAGEHLRRQATGTRG